MPFLAPLNDSPSLDKLAYEKIKEAILTFKFLPNQSLVEGELASQLAISKTPVRDALMRLEKEGLVTRIAYKGTYISDINNQDMANIYEIRIVLEGLAVRLAAPLLTEKDLDFMQELIDDHSKALKVKDVPSVMEANSKFHNTIIGKCSNPRLQDMLYNLDDHLKRYRMLSISQGLRLEKSVPEHVAILKALRDRDPDKAEKALKDHLLSAMHDLYDQDFEELERQLHKD